MKLAALCDGSNIAAALEHAPKCAIYTIENDRITGTEVVDFDAAHAAEFLSGHGVGILLCGKVSPQVSTALTLSGIAVFSGMSGSADMQVGILLMGMLGIADSSVSAALHACGDTTCSGDCSACHSAHREEQA